MKKYLLFAAAMLGLVACDKKDANAPIEPGKKVVLHATVDNRNNGANGPHRIASNGYADAFDGTFKWEEGDQVLVVNAYDSDDRSTFTVIASTINGNQADFEGVELAGGMSDYYVFYGFDPQAVESSTTPLSVSLDGANEIPQTFKPYIEGEGHDLSFSLDAFHPVLNLKLWTINDDYGFNLSKIEYWVYGDEEQPQLVSYFTMTGGFPVPGMSSDDVADAIDEGIDLKEYYEEWLGYDYAELCLPLFFTGGTNYRGASAWGYDSRNFALKFYDMDDNLVMEQSVNYNLYIDSDPFASSGFVSFPELLIVSPEIKMEKGYTYEVVLDRSGDEVTYKFQYTNDGMRWLIRNERPLGVGWNEGATSEFLIDDDGFSIAMSIPDPDEYGTSFDFAFNFNKDESKLTITKSETRHFDEGTQTGTDHPALTLSHFYVNGVEFNIDFEQKNSEED